MPRPKRTKVAPSAPAPRVRNAAKAMKGTAEPRPAPAASNALNNDLYDVSDTEDQAVRSVRHVKKNNGKTKVGAASRFEMREMGMNTRDSEDIDLEAAQNIASTSLVHS